MDSSVNKRIGTREEVFKGLATRTAGGLKKDDIIEKQFGSRKMYISKKLSDKMRENFNIIRTNNPNHLKRIPKRTMVAPKLNENANANATLTNQNKVISETNKKQQYQQPNLQLNQHQQNYPNQRHQQAKTQKLSFKVKENTVRNVFYPELKGMDIKQLKEELVREEADEDLGISSSSDNNNNQPKKEFSIEEMPDIDMASLS